MKKLFLTFGSIFFWYTSFGQVVKGKIVDESNFEMIGVNITTQDMLGTTSDYDGKYELNLTPGEHTINYQFIGFQRESKSFTINSGETLEFNIKMKNDATDLETVVVSAGKFEQKIEETTISIEVIKPALIESKNTTDIQTVLDQTPGVTMTDGQANIRGGSGWSYGAGTRVQVLVDDMPLISGDAGQAQWSLIATENISQVEIIKGASSALYGSSALNGVINIRTSYPGEVPETKINIHSGFYDDAEMESLNWWGGRNQKIYGFDILHKRKIKNLDLVVGGFLLQDEGYRFDEDNNRLRFNFNTRYKNKQVDGLSYGLNGNFLKKDVSSALIWSDYPTAFMPLDSGSIKTSGDVYHIDPYMTYIRNNDKHYLKSRIMKVINDNDSKTEENGQDNQSITYYGEYQYQKFIPKVDLNWTSGVLNEIVFAKADLFQGENYRTNQAIFTQIDKKIGAKLNLSVGARYEQFYLKSEEKYLAENGDSINQIAVGKPVFRAGLNYQLAKATFLRASWGQGFRFPSIAELFIQTEIARDIYVYKNPQLKPETGWSGEIAIRQGFKLGQWMGYLDLAGFIMEYENMMEFSAGFWDKSTSESSGLGFKSINVGDTKISGIELSLGGDGKIRKNKFFVMGGYSFINPISKNPSEVYGSDYYNNTLSYYSNSSLDSSENFLKYRHQHTLKLDVEVNRNKVSAGVSFKYNSFMKNIDAIFADTTFFSSIVPGINESREELDKGDFIIDARIKYRITNQLEASIICNNLTNTLYQSRPANMMPPRMISIKLGLKI